MGSHLLVNKIGQLINNARQRVAVQVKNRLLVTYWHIGQLIVEHEQKSNLRAEYGKQTLREVSRFLTRDYSMGFSLFPLVTKSTKLSSHRSRKSNIFRRTALQ